MDKEMIDKIKNERKIPDGVVEKLTSSREDILNKKITQEKSIKIADPKKFIFTLLIAAIVTLIVVTKTPVGAAIENVLGIRKDSGVESVEKNELPMNLNLTSTQNDREIKLTKFVSTRKKFAFDYQFKIEDEKLKTLLKKYTATNSDHQDIQIGLFANGSTEDIFGGVTSMSTFKVYGDTFYGSVVSTFDTEEIPDNARLELHIYRLAWMDRDEFETAKSIALADSDNPQPFSIETALEYTGDWSFDTKYTPLNQTASTEISNISNITNIVAKSDALQTTVTFNAPIEDSKIPEITVYKNGTKIENTTINYRHRDTGESEIVLDLSALDKTTIYKIQIEEADVNGQILKKVGYFEIQNK